MRLKTCTLYTSQKYSEYPEILGHMILDKNVRFTACVLFSEVCVQIDDSGDLLHPVHVNLAKRIDLCVTNGGNHIEDMLIWQLNKMLKILQIFLKIYTFRLCVQTLGTSCVTIIWSYLSSYQYQYSWSCAETTIIKEWKIIG